MNSIKISDKSEPILEKSETHIFMKSNPINNEHSKLDIKKQLKKLSNYSDKLYILGLIIIIIFSIYIRLRYFTSESIWNDAAVHLWYAQKLLIDPLFFFSQQHILQNYITIHPFVSFFYLITKNIFISGKIVALFFSVSGIIAIYLCGSELRNKTVGLISAAIMSVHHLLWFYDLRILADSPLTTMFIISFYFLIKLEKERTIFYAFLSSAFVLLTVLTKRQAIIFPVALFIYFAIKYRENIFKEKSILICSVLSFGLPMIISLAISPIIGKNLLYILFVNKLILHQGIGSSLSVISQLPWILSWPLIIGTILGITFMLIYKLQYFYLPVTITLIYALWFEIGIGTPLDRYLLPIIPIAIILTATSIDEFANFAKIILKIKWIKFIVIIPLVFLIVSPFYTDGTNLIESKEYSYIGYQDAAAWLEQNAATDSILYAGSPRSMRAFTGREYFSMSGSNDPSGYLINFRENERYQTNSTIFETEIVEYSSQGYEIYLEIDIWEYAQPSWYFPLSQESVDYFISVGFILENIIYKELPTQNGLESTPVILLFKYNPNSII